VLSVNLTYKTRVDESGNTLYCFMTDDGAQSPTLHVHPGDELLIMLKNDLDPSVNPSFHKHNMQGMPGMNSMPDLAISGQSNPDCGAMMMTDTSVNIHYHGTNTPPKCHQDEVIKTLINAGQSFQYHVHFPLDEPPGMYWYHPHVHGISEAAVQGGASGAIVVEGIQNLNHDVARLPQRILMVRDNPVPGAPDGDDVPAWDLSLNYIPVAFPKYTPAIIPMRPGERQFWRVVNASAGTILDLQLLYDGVAQPLEIVGIDGVPIGSQDGTMEGKTIVQKHFLVSPAARVEFIVTGPTKSVKTATLMTMSVDTGPDGDLDPQRPIATIKTSANAAEPSLNVPSVDGLPPLRLRFTGLNKEKPVRQRKLYFSENPTDPTDPDDGTDFFITVEGATPKLFDPENPPAIVTTQGSTEDWVIENRTLENHEFHMHQIHFLVLERDGKPVTQEYRDMIDIPYWTGTGPYPSVKVRMDFRGPDVGDFVYHCHILEHEDHGMMAIIRVLPR
jgi:FtsP/CotA-like multicopper oxidase with cupredoxin domain